ncbi:class I adenylate-forming enzyme family protein [Saccharospirillum salsuginis]|uniref:Acid--CoA ligase n=1 Tax=Saccharospirillum salsuginis TaxID=418750 RepID=A0A918KLJ4_9GAMM|nr:AMP-binding protein [Saccharospirillum salsuginis]GGX65488.1 acid--CoA ligase [Saccharospirillum salsuginis]
MTTLDTGRWAQTWGAKPALVGVPDATCWTFTELDERVRTWVRRLVALGLKRGDRLLWLARNRLDFFAVLMACRRQGWIMVPLNWREVIDTQLEQSRLTEPAAILAERDFQSVATSLHRLLGCALGWLDEELPETDLPEADPAGDDDPWYLLFTSGTTGTPKAVIYTATMAIANARNANAALDLSPDDVTASVLPHYHTAGINLFALPALMHGASVRVYRQFQPDQLMTDLMARRLTKALLVPTQYRRLAETEAFRHADDLSYCASCLASGGAPMDDSLLGVWADRGVVIRNGCGMTETGPTLFFQSEAEARQFPGGVGRAMPMTECKLVGPHGESVEPGQVGEVWVRGPAITPGYWRNAEANGTAFLDGWYRCGDLAHQNRDGHTWIVDRVTDMFICGGENVFPSEIEQCLLHHRAVQEVAVTGEYDRTWGETATAFVVLKPGHWATEDELQRFCKQRLATYKVPRRLVFLDELPRTPTGKVRRVAVRKWVRRSERE